MRIKNTNVYLFTFKLKYHELEIKVNSTLFLRAFYILNSINGTTENVSECQQNEFATVSKCVAALKLEKIELPNQASSPFIYVSKSD